MFAKSCFHRANDLKIVTSQVSLLPVLFRQLLGGKRRMKAADIGRLAVLGGRRAVGKPQVDCSITIFSPRSRGMSALAIHRAQLPRPLFPDFP